MEPAGRPEWINDFNSTSVKPLAGAARSRGTTAVFVRHYAAVTAAFVCQLPNIPAG
jgi:hypothetical protein